MPTERTTQQRTDDELISLRYQRRRSCKERTVPITEIGQKLLLPYASRMPAFEGVTQWLNPQPLDETDLRGKVVLVDFGTFTCINWIRTLPYVRAWHERYREHGLIIVGVQTPEFGIEHDIDLVS